MRAAEMQLQSTASHVTSAVCSVTGMEMTIARVSTNQNPF